MRWLAGTALLVLLGLAGLHALSRSTRYQVAGRIVARVGTDQPLVALTFDDGPTAEHTDEVLAILREKGVRATFFLIGADVARCAAETRRIVSAGHEVGNHSYTHARMLFQSREWMRDELDRTDALLRAAGWTRPPLFRPPFGKKLFNLPLVLAQTGRVTITWDVDADSADAGDAAAIRERVVRHASNGSIVLMHAMYPSRVETRRAIGPIIDGLRARGLSFVTVSELLAGAP